MADALENVETEEDEEFQEGTEVEETREERIARLKGEMAELRNAGLTDAEVREIAGDIEDAGSKTTDKEGAKAEAQEIADKLESEHGVELSNASVDRLAKRIVELQKEGNSGSGSGTSSQRTRQKVTKTVDQPPSRTHFSERRLWGGNR